MNRGFSRRAPQIIEHDVHVGGLRRQLLGDPIGVGGQVDGNVAPSAAKAASRFAHDPPQ